MSKRSGHLTQVGIRCRVNRWSYHERVGRLGETFGDRPGPGQQRDVFQRRIVAQFLRCAQRAQHLDSKKPQVGGAKQRASPQFIQRGLCLRAVIPTRAFIELPEDPTNGTRLIDSRGKVPAPRR